MHIHFPRVFYMYSTSLVKKLYPIEYILQQCQVISNITNKNHNLLCSFPVFTVGCLKGTTYLK